MIDDKPYRSGSSDVLALFAALFWIAVFLVFLGRATTYAPLRSDGEIAIGMWVDGFVMPTTGQFEAYYRFQLNDKTYRGRQFLHAGDYSGDGRPVDVLYLPENPKMSRVLGGEAIELGDGGGIFVSLAGLLMSLQHIFAYYRERSSWVLASLRQLRRLRSRLR